MAYSPPGPTEGYALKNTEISWTATIPPYLLIFVSHHKISNATKKRAGTGSLSIYSNLHTAYNTVFLTAID